MEPAAAADAGQAAEKVIRLNPFRDKPGLGLSSRQQEAGVASPLAFSGHAAILTA
jgi:hypothetical protein